MDRCDPIDSTLLADRDAPFRDPASVRVRTPEASRG